MHERFPEQDLSPAHHPVFYFLLNHESFANFEYEREQHTIMEVILRKFYNSYKITTEPDLISDVFKREEMRSLLRKT